MNILALTSAYPHPDDGNEVVTPTVKYFCEKWAELGHNVIVVHNNSRFPSLLYKIPNSIRKKMESRFGHTFPTKKSKESLRYKSNEVLIYRLPMAKAVPYIKFRKKTIIKQCIRIEEVLKNDGFVPDIILSHWVNPQIEICLELKKIYKNAITSLVFHGDCWPKQIKDFDLINKVKELDAIGCRNDSYAKIVQTELRLNKRPFVCYSGVPDEVAKKQIMSIDNIKYNLSHDYIFVGRLVEYKNVDVIIKALHKVYPLGDFRLHIVGTGAERENLEVLSKKICIENQVIFHGQMPRDQVFNLMKECFAFIMVSNNETFGMVYIEAMLAGCVTIASRNGGIDGVIIDGENGYLSNQGDIDSLVEILRKIKGMESKRVIAIKKNAVKTAFEYRDSKVAEKYLEDVCTWKK